MAKKENDILKLKNASKDELDSKIIELKKELMNMRFQHAAGQVKDLSAFKIVRKNIARLMTFKNMAKENNKTEAKK